MARRATGRRTPAQVEGEAAEARAADYLARQGLAIVARNYRTRFGEIDLVARDHGTLVFVEVRRRASAACGGAAESVDARKRRRIAAAASQYLARLGSEPPCRFDVVTLQGEALDWLRAAFTLN